MAEKEGEIANVLWFSSERRIFGIDLTKLTVVNEAVDWESVSPLTCDFSLDIAKSNLPMFMSYFVLNSKIYLMGGLDLFFDDDFPFVLPSTSGGRGPSYGIYEFDFDPNTKQPLLSVADSIPKLPQHPETLAESFSATISGNVYFIQSYDIIRGETGFMVLDSTLKQWINFPFPPLVDKSKGLHDFFVFQDTLFAQCFIDNHRHLLSFNPKTAAWTRECDDSKYSRILNSFWVTLDDRTWLLHPKLEVAVPWFSNDDNCTIMLSSSYYEVLEKKHDARRYRVRIYALMVNRQGLLLYQPLDECLEGIQPTYCSRPEHLFVNIGNGKVCALVLGSAEERSGLLLCMSVFSLAKSELDTDFGTNSPPKEQKFLSIDIISKNVFTSSEETEAYIPQLKAFVWPPPEDI